MLAAAPVPDPPAEPDDFDSAKDDVVIVPEQQPVAAYFNARRDLVIGQSSHHDEDAFVSSWRATSRPFSTS
jgi:hypothetical protein